MNPRTVSARDLETMAHAAHERVELPGPEGGWATAVINGRSYRARVAPAGGETVHACPPGDSDLMPCCGRTPFEVPRTDRMTLDAGLVTCKRAEES